jgi:DNA-binding NtrC family response regulator
MQGTIKLLWVSTEPVPAALNTVAQFEIESVPGAQEGLQRLRHQHMDAVLADFPLPGWNAEELLEEVHRIEASLPFFVRDPRLQVAEAVRLTRLGAQDFLGTEIDPTDLASRVEAAVEARRSRDLSSLQSSLVNEPWRRFLIGGSHAIERVCHIVRLISPKRSTVLITGETGTGKEMVARALHSASPRANLAMVSVNCTALPENLLEAELFGHVKGAFTGAWNQRVGRFEQAHRSTLFLDEIGDLPLELQAKLLRVLQEREFQRIGSSETIKVDVRVVAASNCDLARRVDEGRFREDLYYRLNVVPVHMAPLRERLQDIPILAAHFIEKICRLEDIGPKRLTPETLERLRRHDWPGNVRQLENAVEMAIALSGDREILYPADFPLPARHTRLMPVAAQVAATELELPDEGLDYEETVSRFERNILQQALRRTSGNKKQAAEILRLKRTTLGAKLRSLGATA